MTSQKTTPPSGVGPMRPRMLGAPAKRLLGNWQLDRRIGAGAMTSVYEARPLGCPPDRPADFVVKLLQEQHVNDPIARQTLAREVEVARHISHPNLVPVLEAQLDVEPGYIVMPRLEGARLGDAIRSVGRISIPQTLWCVRQVAQALSLLHERGWVHGDVKPDNIIVARSGHATLIDLSFALKRDESIFDAEKPLLGSLAYVAPELLRSTNATHPVTDIYSLGASMFEMLSGRIPFTGSNPAQLVEAHLSQVPPRLDELSSVPAEIAELVARMLAKTPLRRPQSAQELIELVTRIEIDTLESRVA